MLNRSPNPVDVTDFQFRQQCRLKVFERAPVSTPHQLVYNKLAVSSRFGLLFVATDSIKLQVIPTKFLQECTFSKNSDDWALYPRRELQLNGVPSYLAMNCTGTSLAVVTGDKSIMVLDVYDVRSLSHKQQLPLGGGQVRAIAWNPTVEDAFIVCHTDYSLILYQMLDGANWTRLDLAGTLAITCSCWSPKGKQLAVGDRNGAITQYKPNLQAVRTIKAPPTGQLKCLVDLQWVSNYQFIGIYQVNAERCAVVVVNAPRSGDPVFINYDDICYSMGIVQPMHYYSILQHHWSVLMVASANSGEVGVLGSTPGDSIENRQWLQWNMLDTARAELPLTAQQESTLPIGMELFTGCTNPVKFGEVQLPPPPLLLLLSHCGDLCCFQVVNGRTTDGICSPPEQDSSTHDESLYVVPPLHKKEIVSQETPQPQPPPTPPPATPTPPPVQIQQKELVSAAVDKPAPQVPQPEPDDPLESIDENLLKQLIIEDCKNLDNNVSRILQLSKSLSVSIGTNAEMTQIATDASELSDFLDLVVETSNSQCSEVHILKQNLLQAWTWYEEAQANHDSTTEDNMKVLLQLKPLDSVSASQLANIKRLGHYLESQLSQAHHVLDDQWDQFQDHCRNDPKVRLPTMEAIFQTMVRHAAIIEKLRLLLKHIGSKMRSRPRPSHTLSLAAATNNLDLLADELSFLNMSTKLTEDSKTEQYQPPIKTLSEDKVSQLRKYLSKRPIPTVSNAKPDLSVSSVLQSSIYYKKSQREQISTLLNAKLSPIKKDPVAIPETPTKGTSAAAAATTAIESTPIPVFKFGSSLASVSSVVPVGTKSAFALATPTTSIVVPPKVPESGGPSVPIQSPLRFKNLPTSTIIMPISTEASSSSTTKPTVLLSTASKLFVSNAANTPIPLVKTTANVVTSSTAASFLTSANTTVMKPSFIVSTTPTSTVTTTLSTMEKTIVTTGTTSVTTIPTTASVAKFGISTISVAEKLTFPTVTTATSTATITTTNTGVVKSLFSSTSATSTALFSTGTTVATATTPSTSFFGATTNTPSIFTASQPSIFGGGTTSTSSSTTPTILTVPTLAITTASSTNDATSVFSTSKPVVFSSTAPATSIFGGGTATTTTPSIGGFLSAPAVTTQTSNLFANTFLSSTAPQTTVSTVATDSNTTAATSIVSTGFGIAPQPPFGAPTTTSTTASSAFGVVPQSTFGAPTTSTTVASAFGVVPQSTFGTPTTSSPFGGVPQPAFSSTPPTSTVLTGTTAGTFGMAQQSTFATPSTPTTVSSSAFGVVPQSTFGTPPATVTSGPTVFGHTPSPNNTFGTSPPSFGQPAATTGLFGAAPLNSSSTSTTSTTGFGVTNSSPFATSSAFQQKPLFGSAVSSNTASVFGGGTIGTVVSTTTPIFGQSTSTNIFASSPMSAFGQQQQQAPATSGFGQQTSPFGQQQVPSGSTFPAFGSTTTSAPTAPSAFSAALSATGGSIFGGGTAPAASATFGASQTAANFSFASGGGGSSFGFGSLNVAPSTTAGGTAFGQASSNVFAPKPASSIFGGASSATTTAFGADPQQSTAGSLFGQKPATPFGQQASCFSFSSAAAGGGGATGGFGSFSAPGTGGGVGQTGFSTGGGGGGGTTGTFGAAPMLNTSGGHAFGSSATFGGAPTFGAASAFGSTAGTAGKIFGSPTGSTGFGTAANPTPAGQTAGFGNLANQSTVGFGNIAQQAANTPGAQPFTTNTSFSSWR